MKIAVWKFFSVTENVVQFNSKDLTEYIKVNGERFCCDQGDLMRMGNVSVYNIFLVESRIFRVSQLLKLMVIIGIDVSEERCSLEW